LSSSYILLLYFKRYRDVSPRLPVRPGSFRPGKWVDSHRVVSPRKVSRRYLASCTHQFGSNLTKIIFQGKHFNYFIVVGEWRHVFWSGTHYSISLRYTRNIVQLNLFYIKFNSKHFFIYIINTITNWRVSLSKRCHSWPNNVVTHSCAAHICELLCYLIIRDIFLIMKLVNKL
jgi:hypothetical protein